MEKGWALKKHKICRPLTEKQRQYLLEKYNHGIAEELGGSSIFELLDFCVRPIAAALIGLYSFRRNHKFNSVDFCGALADATFLAVLADVDDDAVVNFCRCGTVDDDPLKLTDVLLLVGEGQALKL
uniref:Uncharacterized protein n=1 Tax=Romanomermis culicivorax TaxID=13658 RepID=A0A915LC54_ROMCU